MAINLTGAKPDYDVVLRDDSGIEIGLPVIDSNGNHDPTGIVCTPVERSSLKTSQGNQSYSDLEPPYTVLAQSDWSGGRAAKTYEDDVTRFADSCRANTGRAFKVFLNGRETYGTGVRSANTHLPGSMRMIALDGNQDRLAVRFQANASYTVDKIGLWVSVFGEPAGTLTVRLCADHASGTKPGTVLQTKTITYADLATLSLSELFLFDITNNAVVSGTYYWVEVYATTSDVAAGTYWKVGVSDTAGTTYQSADGGTNWSASAYDLYYRVMDATAGLPGIMVKYMRALYFVTQPTDGSVSKIYKNGVHGACISNAGALSKLKAGGAPGWTTNQFAGCVVAILEGPGITESQPWRRIVSNNASELTVDSDWLIAHTTSTSFIILGMDSWVEKTGVGITQTVTSVEVTDKNLMYLAQGASTVVWQYREYNNAGTWTQNDTNCVTNPSGPTIPMAVFMRTYYSGDQQKIVRSTGDTKVENSNVPANWTSPFGWASAGKAVGSDSERITGLTRYVDSSEAETIWVFKEGGPWVFDGADIVSRSREELARIRSESMGRVGVKSDVFLYFSVMNTIWRFYDPTFDDVGPMLDEGLPANRMGTPSAILAYPGRTIVAYDAGASGYSTVIENTGGASWHEVYRAPKGERITALEFQVIPGSSNVDRLWIRQGADFVWVPFPSLAFDPKQDSNYPYMHEGMVELAPMYAGLMDAWKYWKTLKLQIEDLVANTTWVEADYQLDDGDWVTMGSTFTDSPLDEHDFGETDSDGRSFGVSSKKFKLRLRMLSVDYTKSPIITAAIIEAVTVTKPKFTYMFSTKTESKDLNGNPDPELTSDQKTALVALGVEDSTGDFGTTLTPTQKVKLLKAWSGRAQSLWMTSAVPLFNGLPVFLAPPPMRNLTISEKEQEWTYSMTVTLQEA